MTRGGLGHHAHGRGERVCRVQSVVPSRLVRLVNICIAVLLVAAAVVVFWFGIRPLPKTSGSITAPVQGSATVERDGRGIPHIQASSWQDAVFLQGYVTAQDRLWQMDGLRRFAAGELSEVFGAATVQQDVISRRMRLRAIAEADLGKMSATERAVFTEYARGVTYFIRTHRGNYSFEFDLPGHSYDPKPWSVVDSILVGLVMFRDLTDTLKLDLDRGALFAVAKDPAKMQMLFPAVQGGQVSPGSNTWAVSGAHTADGKPMLANDPHLSYGIPSIWHIVHLKAPGLNVIGATLPGVPGVLIGHNEHIAWGITALETDELDVYKEKLDLRTGRYLYNGQTLQAAADTEVIGVRGAKPTLLQNWVTVHGPIVATGDNGAVYSMHWSAADGLTFPFWDIDRAQTWQQFHSAAAALWGPPLNLSYADDAGNIGFIVAGAVPIRNGFNGETPLDGTTASTQWAGYIPRETLPVFFNPPGGMVASGNQNPFPPNFAYQVPGNYHDRYRINQIFARLKAKPKLDVNDMLAIQKDVYSAYDLFLAQQILAAVRNRGTLSNSLIQQAVPILQSWNGQMDKDLPAPLITQLVSSVMGQSLVASNMNSASAPPLLPHPEIVQDLLSTRPNGWVPTDNWDAWIIQQVATALQDGAKSQGTSVSHWRWGRTLQWNFLHPVGKALPFVKQYFDIGPVPMSGSGTTVKQTTPTLGPSQRMVVDLGNLDKSVQNLATGESGFVLSKHYKDEWPAYYVGTSFPMEFRNIRSEHTLHIHPGGE